MKRILTAALALSLLASGSALAQPGHPDRDRPGGPDRRDAQDIRGDYRPGGPRWSRGDRLPPQYRQNQNGVTDWRQRGLRQPPRGYRWYAYGDNNYFLAAIATGLILETVYRDDRDQRWNQSYSRRYTYQDDVYYRECRNSADPAGVLLGALIGGLIGKAAGGDDHRSGSTVAGVIIGGAVGAALTKDMDCNDRSYAYRSYYDGFNAGRPGARYSWRNPANSHRGDMVVNDYYSDRSGFRCANFTQTIYIQGRPQVARGRACRQPDGSWAVVN
jgi:Ni/Co efflux regulator RcnB